MGNSIVNACKPGFFATKIWGIQVIGGVLRRSFQPQRLGLITQVSKRGKKELTQKIFPTKPPSGQDAEGVVSAPYNEPNFPPNQGRNRLILLRRRPHRLLLRLKWYLLVQDFGAFPIPWSSDNILGGMVWQIAKDKLQKNGGICKYVLFSQPSTKFFKNESLLDGPPNRLTKKDHCRMKIAAIFMWQGSCFSYTSAFRSA